MGIPSLPKRINLIHMEKGKHEEEVLVLNLNNVSSYN